MSELKTKIVRDITWVAITNATGYRVEPLVFCTGVFYRVCFYFDQYSL